MKDNDDIFDSMNTFRRKQIDNLTEGNSTAVGAGTAGVAGLIGGAVAVGLGLTGLAIPVIALGSAYIAYKNNKGVSRYGIRALFNRVGKENGED